MRNGTHIARKLAHRSDPDYRLRICIIRLKKGDMIAAYLRVSTLKQHTVNQREEIVRYAHERGLDVDRWIEESASGNRRYTERLLGSELELLQRGDTLIVTELSRLSRSLTEIMAILGRCLEKGITLYSTKDGYAFDSGINSKVLCFAFGLAAELERRLISLRTREALALRKSQGKTLGRRAGYEPKLVLLARNRQHIAARLRRGESLRSLCRKYGVSASTFDKFRRRYPSIERAVQAARKRRQAVNAVPHGRVRL